MELLTMTYVVFGLFHMGNPGLRICVYLGSRATPTGGGTSMYPGSSGYPGSITEGPKVSGRLVVSGQGMGNDTSDQCRTVYPGKETNLKENLERARRPDRVHNLSGQTLYPGSE